MGERREREPSWQRSLDECDRCGDTYLPEPWDRDYVCRDCRPHEPTKQRGVPHEYDDSKDRAYLARIQAAAEAFVFGLTPPPGPEGEDGDDGCRYPCYVRDCDQTAAYLVQWPSGKSGRVCRVHQVAFTDGALSESDGDHAP